MLEFFLRHQELGIVYSLVWDSGYDAALPPDLGIVDLNQVTCADSNDLLQVPRCAQQQHLYLGSEPEVPSEPTTLSPSPWIISDSMLVLEGAANGLCVTGFNSPSVLSFFFLSGFQALSGRTLLQGRVKIQPPCLYSLTKPGLGLSDV